MPHNLQIAYFAHTLRSDWNNGNAHFLRGLLQSLGEAGATLNVFEPEDGWSVDNLRKEESGAESLKQYADIYPNLRIALYHPDVVQTAAHWRNVLRDTDLVIVHEWNPPALAQMLLTIRDEVRFRLLFHDTHHRASSSPEQIRLFGIERFDGVLAFGEALRKIYREQFGLKHVWTLHEGADTRVFKPVIARKTRDVVWIGNWGEGERSWEIRRFLLQPAAYLPQFSFSIYGVRYPEDGLRALRAAGANYGGYLPNLEAPCIYATARATVHVPRQQYSKAMAGIPTIRVFEALACGIPLISAPWIDAEGLFREGDFLWASDTAEMVTNIERLMSDASFALQQAAQGRETILARHTCAHRAQELLGIAEDLFR